jgi:hypothetical protein
MQGCDLNKCEVVEMVKRHNMRPTYTVRHRLSMVEASNMDEMVVVHALDWVRTEEGMINFGEAPKASFSLPCRRSRSLARSRAKSDVERDER